MDLRHMRHFVAVAEELHFGRAAKRLHIAQPPLSQSIKRLEVYLGVVLFERSRRGVALTDAGQIFLRESRRTLLHADLAIKLTQREASKVREIRVSFIGPALYRLLPGLLASFTKANPDTNVRLFEQPSSAQAQALLGGNIDVGFVTAGTADIEDCSTLVVEQAPLVAVIPSAWPIARRQSVTLADLTEHPFILPPAQKFSQKPTELLSMFNKAGLVPLVTQESTHANTTISLVAAGLGYSLITATAALSKPQKVSFVPISDLRVDARWGLMMIWRPDQLTGGGASFVEFVREYVSKMPELLGDDSAPV